MQQQEPVEEYQGEERDVAFVPTSDHKAWTYCRVRFRDRWAGNKHRAIPSGFVNDGRVGWWFPKVWLRDFADLHPGWRPR